VTVASTQPRRRRRRGEQGRRDILDAAWQVIARKGMESTRFADVAAESGASVSTLQYVFGTREELVVAAVVERADSWLDEIRAELQTVDDPVVRLGRLVDYMASADQSRAEARSNWLVWVEYWRAALRSAGLRSRASASYAGWRRLLREVVDDGVAAGVFAPAIDIEDIVLGVNALVDGLCIQVSLGLREVTPKEAGRIVRVWLAEVLRSPELSSPRR
jgi:AcrR family transcriptional regulator